MTKGKSIVLYGINNLGKTTQALMLVAWLNSMGIPCVYLKFPVYNLWPTGPRINAYLRYHNPERLTPLQFQELQVQNRKDFEHILKGYLDNGVWVVMEDYVGTGVAWGMAAGIDQILLENMNSGLYKEDLAIFFDGERFISGIEKEHTHEQDNLLTEKCRFAHQKLAKENGWVPVNANKSKEEIHQLIRNTVTVKFNLQATA